MSTQPITTKEPFKLIPTTELRQRERDVWDAYPQEIVKRWQEEDNEVSLYQLRLNDAAKAELNQTKDSNKLYLKQGNLFYQSTKDEIKPTLG